MPPMSDHDDEDIKDFYTELQEVVDSMSGKDILVMQGDLNAKIGEDAAAHWSSTCGKYCNQITNDRGIRLLEFAGCNSLAVTNTLGPHKMSRRRTWHRPN